MALPTSNNDRNCTLHQTLVFGDNSVVGTNTPTPEQPETSATRVAETTINAQVTSKDKPGSGVDLAASAGELKDGSSGGSCLTAKGVPSPQAVVKSGKASHEASNALLLPPFYVPGEGGRGRGRPLEGDALTPSVRAAIVSTWQAASSASLSSSSSSKDQKQLQAGSEGEELDPLLLEVALDPAEFAAITRDLVGLPSLFNRPLMARINRLFGRGGGGGGGQVTKAQRKSSLPGAASKSSSGLVSFEVASRRGGQGKESEHVAKEGKKGGGDTKYETEEEDKEEEEEECYVPWRHPLGSDGGHSLKVTLKSFLAFWEAELAPFDHSTRFFRLAKQPSSEGVTREDLRVFVEELVRFHPGLQFLGSHGEFQEKYALTVLTRILYSANTSRTGLISAKEWRRASVLEAWQAADGEQDINRVPRFFSYEHFYVLYCRYWELDGDHDGELGRDDLLGYGGHRLSSAIVDKIFECAPRPPPPRPRKPPLPTAAAAAAAAAAAEGGEQQQSRAAALDRSAVAANAAAAATGQSSVGVDRSVMRYDDFVYFMLSEEDKGNAASLGYWFACVDVDGDGKLGMADMRYFYDVQTSRMDSLGHDVVGFADVLCQMTDMIKPQQDGAIVLSDLLRPDIVLQAGAVFDCLFNVDKFLGFEQRDPFAERHKRDDPFDCDWDRFAYVEYNRLAQEEEAREGEMELDGEAGNGEWNDGGGRGGY